MQLSEILSTLGIQTDNGGTSTGTAWISSSGEQLISHSPVDGKEIARVQSTDKAGYESVVAKAEAAGLAG
jgi:aldehyde dehydrogenase (NAD+)